MAFRYEAFSYLVQLLMILFQDNIYLTWHVKLYAKLKQFSSKQTYL